MKTLLRSILVVTAAAAASYAQQWEFGGAGGAGFVNSVPVSGIGSATAGFQNGGAFGGYVGFNQSKHIGGEIRYGYLQSNLKLTSGGKEATFSGMSHVVHYDLILKTTRNNGKVQLFAALGGGMKFFKSTGVEHAFQPLSQFGYFTKGQQIKPMASVGGGVKFALTNKVFLRTEIRDYISPFPTEILTPAPGAKYGRLLHDIVPMVGIGIQM